MKLGTFEVATPVGALRRIGVETPAGIVDATAARVALLERSLPADTAERVGVAQAPPDMLAVLGSGPAGLDWIREAVESVTARGQQATARGQTTLYAPAAVRLVAPVPRPPGIANFSVWPAHTEKAKEHGFALGENKRDNVVKPYWKGNPDSVVGPGTPLVCPPYARELDVECELVCIVGTGGRDLDPASAAAAIGGYTIVNDVSVRAIQRDEMQSGRGPSKGKDFDGGNAMGPWIVTPDEIGDVARLRLSLHVDGRELSHSTAESMVWSFPEMLSYLSQGQTIRPGHVISAGCYAGGSGLDLGRAFRPGEVVELRISGIGALVNPIA